MESSDTLEAKDNAKAAFISDTIFWLIICAVGAFVAKVFVDWAIGYHGIPLYPFLLFLLWFSASTFIGYRKYTAALHLIDNPPPRAPTFRDILEARLRDAVVENDYVFPSEVLWKRILDIGEDLYNRPRYWPAHFVAPAEDAPPDDHKLWKLRLELWAKSEQWVLTAIVNSLLGFIKRLPRPAPAPFSRLLVETTNPASLIFDMIQPFREKVVTEFQSFKWFADTYAANVGVIKAQPQDYTGPIQELPETYFRGLPLLPLLQTLVPYYPFTDKERFTHHWCMGDNGSGKTTFLRHMIDYDLGRVSRNECSLIVMDSKGLAREMRTLKRFDTGSDLDGRVIIIDNDCVFPLNPFHLPKAQGSKILTYMLASLQDASELQSGSLLFYIDAAYAYPNPTLYTIQDLLNLPDHVVPPIIEKRADKDTKNWFKNTRHTVHRATSGGLKQRLAIFLKQNQHGLAKMFNANSWALDMSEVHDAGTVLLVDTNRAEVVYGGNGKDGAALLGRLIISLVDDLASRRTHEPGPPLFVVIDEAQDYIAKDETFADIMEKARSSKIGVTIAHHHLKQAGGFSPGVIGALEQVGIKTRCYNPGSVSVWTRKQEFVLFTDELEFSHGPQNPRYEQLRQRLAQKLPKIADHPADIVEPKDYS